MIKTAPARRHGPALSTQRPEAPSNCTTSPTVECPSDATIVSNVAVDARATFNLDVPSTSGTRLAARVSMQDAEGNRPVAFGITGGAQRAPDELHVLDASAPNRLRVDSCAGVALLRVEHPGLATVLESVSLTNDLGPPVSIVLRPE